MFRTAAKKIAHNSTLPVLGGNKDLRALQELITAEKAVLNSLQRLSADIARASEALKAWGMGEGDDLGDTLSASCALYLHFSDALQVFANHHGSVREQMKSVRTREERLDELRRRRKSLAAEAESAEKKLSKMGPDSKNLQTQMDHLNKLREEIRIMDTDIMAEEASLSDYKRSTSKAWLGYKFGGLVECCEKGIIIADHGRLVIAEIPLDRTEPGLPRAYYNGYSNTENLVTDARRALSTVSFSQEPNLGGLVRSADPYDNSDIASLPPTQYGFAPTSQAGDTSRRTSVVMPAPTGDASLSDTASTNGQMPRSPLAGGYGALSLAPSSPFMAPSNQSLSYVDIAAPMPPPADTGEFGALPQEPYSPRMSSMRSPEDRDRLTGARVSRFSTVPALGGPRPPRDSRVYASSHANERPPSLDVQRPQDDFSSSIAQALEDKFNPKSGANGGEKGGTQESRHTSHSSPPPMYTSVVGHAGEDDVQLAYMSPEDEAETSPERRSREDRKVKFEPSGGFADDVLSSSQVAEQTAQGDGRRSFEQSERLSSNAAVPPTSNTQAPASYVLSPPSAQVPAPPVDQRTQDADAAREVSREIDALMSSSALTSTIPEPSQRTPSPLIPPQAPFARRTVSPRPPMDAAIPPPGSPRVSTGGGSQFSGYTRERDRSLASPTSSLAQSSAEDREPASPVSSRSRVSGDGPPTAVPAIALQRPSPSPSSFSVNTNMTAYRSTPQSEYASPLSSPLPTPTAPGSFYSLPAASASGKISAAAFRRQARSPSIPAVPGSDAPNVDTGPLMVKKRPLPSSPSGNTAPGAVRQSIPRVPSAPLSSRDSLDAGDGSGRFRSTSAAQAFGDRSSRGGQEVAGSDDDYDYISAYTGPEGRESGGYEHGKFATNLEDGRMSLR
ncbi:Eisosome component PIL1-domain-containing protein [Fomitopsis serialis]|uniref:Eisosome component PIL1-domain-containing protein n=1 Tax=Fomitopsis serialis TaxID=139415 RepID=UPI002007BE47|nr:Eisosome component PIL1-domain-containing protein [Neoantrodia serialis]KAH9918048.1 Eisosome component PIL1-domain-containing protein [Neoantrodia serialis]